MNKRDDFLIEILTEELPPKALFKMAHSMSEQIKERFQKMDLAFGEVVFFATPRRLAVLVENLASHTPDQLIDRKGPALNAAYDANGKPTPACVGFAKLERYINGSIFCLEWIFNYGDTARSKGAA